MVENDQGSNNNIAYPVVLLASLDHFERRDRGTIEGSFDPYSSKRTSSPSLKTETGG
jgi:hypothetical protein